MTIDNNKGISTHLKPQFEFTNLYFFIHTNKNDIKYNKYIIYYNQLSNHAYAILYQMR
jgi:hypothetical protein